MRSLLIVSMMAALSGCATALPPQVAVVGSFTVRSSTGQALGNVDVIPSGDGYRLGGMLRGLPSGTVLGMHLHTKGMCDAPGFAGAGGHLNPAMHKHGTLNAKGPHLGDLPNIAVSTTGDAMIDGALMGARSAIEGHLFDADGTALVVHASADDYRTDPSGNSGARIACGVLQRR